MAVMGRRRVFLRRVTLHADAGAGRSQLRRVRLVAIAAGDAGCEHPALLERPIVVDLVQHLAIGMIEPAGKWRDHWVSDSQRPGTQSSENSPRRAWHRPQVSTSLRTRAGVKLR